MTTPDDLQDLIQVRLAHFAPLKAQDGTLGVMLSFFRKPVPQSDKPVRIALTIPQAEDLVEKLKTMIDEAKAGRSRHQSLS